MTDDHPGTKWECERCGCLNPPAAITCISCGERHDAQSRIPRRNPGLGAGRWMALTLSGVALSLSLGLVVTSFTPLPPLVPIVVATGIVGKAYDVRSAGSWIAALVLVLTATTVVGIAVGFLFLAVAGV